MNTNNIELISVLLLCAPFIIESYEDRKGDKHPNKDWIYRGMIMLASSIAVHIINPNRNFIQAFVFSFGAFSLFFPYLVNIVHNKKRWWDSLSKTAWPDKLPLWAGTPWYGRLFILLVVFAACSMVYACPGKILDYNCPCIGYR